MRQGRLAPPRLEKPPALEARHFMTPRPTLFRRFPSVSSSLILYRRLLRYVRPYWWAFALAIVGMIIVAAGDVLMAYMVMPIIQKLQNPDPAMTLQLPLAVVAV